jgi:ElaB/YqjD/DUF883 family membrane-anchored ribosome-binding protein
MRSILLTLSTLAVCAFAQNYDYYGNATAWNDTLHRAADYNVTIDWKEAGELADDIEDRLEDYNKWAKNHTKAAQKELAKSLKKVYEDSTKKIVKEFKDKVVPVLEVAEDFIDDVETNRECDNDCAVKCWEPKKADKVDSKWVLGFNRTCFTKCNCSFKFEKWSDKKKKELNDTVKGLDKKMKDLIKFGKDLAEEIKDKVAPALEEYQKRDQEEQDKFNEMAKDILTEDLGCNARCVDTCTDKHSNNFWRFSECIADCDCQAAEDLVDIKPVTFAQVVRAENRAHTFASKYEARYHQ